MPSLFKRILALALLFAAELILITIWLDSQSIGDRSGLISFVHDWGAWILRGVAGFAALFMTFAYLKVRDEIDSFSIHEPPIRGIYFGAHAVALIGFAGLSFLLYGKPVGTVATDLMVIGWLATGIAAIVFAGLAELPWPRWVRLFRMTGSLWLYAIVAVVLGCFVGHLGQLVWPPASRLTFVMTKSLLTPFLSDVISVPDQMLLGTSDFSVTISPQCSGLEGAGLILAFGVLWLLIFRRECRFPQALVLLPAGIILIFLFNAVRLAALILLGNAGAPRVAAGGFHSQAGWILFNVVAVGFALAAKRVRWFTKKSLLTERLASVETSEENPTAAYVFPFLAIMAAGMISRAASNGFEWFFALRFLAAMAALWFFRRSYASFRWPLNPVALALGLITFIVWISPEYIHHPTPHVGMPDALAAASPGLRYLWIVLRVLTAIVVVPIAEELAFRGFLMRRLASPDFETVPYQTIGWFPLLASSIIFGLMHGTHWLVGCIAGILFGLAAKRRGKITDAIIAHAIANALLAVYVLMDGRWDLW